jgi:hypothetical protein
MNHVETRRLQTGEADEAGLQVQVRLRARLGGACSTERDRRHHRNRQAQPAPRSSLAHHFASLALGGRSGALRVLAKMREGKEKRHGRALTRR